MEHPFRCEVGREEYWKEYRVTGVGSYLPLLPETLTPLNFLPQKCSVGSAVSKGVQCCSQFLRG